MAKWHFDEGYRRGRAGSNFSYSFIGDIAMSDSEKDEARRGFEMGSRDRLREMHDDEERRKGKEKHDKKETEPYTGPRDSIGSQIAVLVHGLVNAFGWFLIFISLLGLLVSPYVTIPGHVQRALLSMVVGVSIVAGLRHIVSQKK